MKKTAKKQKNGSVLDDRRAEGLNQMQYWGRYGITQSGGSRYESGRTIPKPARLLIWLRKNGRITDRDLADAMKAVSGKARR